MDPSERLAKGLDGEKNLRAWLDAEGLAHVSICQHPETFAALFAGHVKRPDFLLLLESIGLIAIDVKNQTQSQRPVGYTLTLDVELRRAIAFERLFRIPLWYVYPCEESDQTAWYWISALKALQEGDKRLNADKVEFLIIALEHFERIVTNADLGKLYTHRLSGVNKIASQPFTA